MEKLALEIPKKGSGTYNLKPVADMPTGGFNTLESIIRWGLVVLLVGATLLALLFLILGGIQWITSGGNKEKLQAAQKKIMYAVIGLVISLSAFLIINFFGDLFGIKFFGS